MPDQTSDIYVGGGCSEWDNDLACGAGWSYFSAGQIKVCSSGLHPLKMTWRSCFLSAVSYYLLALNWHRARRPMRAAAAQGLPFAVWAANTGMESKQ
jgi:hypothetical protein